MQPTYDDSYLSFPTVEWKRVKKSRQEINPNPIIAFIIILTRSSKRKKEKQVCCDLVISSHKVIGAR